MVRKIKDALLVLALIWASVATYFVLRIPEYKEFIDSYVTGKKVERNFDLETEYKFINTFLDNYFQIGKSPIESSIAFLKSSTAESLHDYFVNERRSILEKFRKNNGTQSFELLDLNLNKQSNGYKALLKVSDRFGEKTSQYLVVVKTMLGRDQKDLYIKNWSEQIISTPPTNKQGPTIEISKNSFATIKLPCRYTGISYDKDSIHVDSSLYDDHSKLLFKTDEGFNGKTTLKTSCGRRKFQIDLKLAGQSTTLYRQIALEDGTLSKRRLSEKEKMEKILKEQLGVEIQ